MSLAIQQPYFFPYSIYFQLVQRVDTFVFFDDVNFVKRGFIHRNSIPTKNGQLDFSIPLQKASQNKLINETHVHPERYRSWRSTFLQTFHQNHKNGPYYSAVRNLLHQVLEWRDGLDIAQLASRSVRATSEYLGLKTKFLNSSSLDYDRDNGARNKIISLCQTLQETDYINLPGGRKIYEPSSFDEHDIHLSFVSGDPITYDYDGQQWQGHSILAAMVYRSVEEICAYLEKQNEKG